MPDSKSGALTSLATAQQHPASRRMTPPDELGMLFPRPFPVNSWPSRTPPWLPSAVRSAAENGAGRHGQSLSKPARLPPLPRPRLPPSAPYEQPLLGPGKNSLKPGPSPSDVIAATNRRYERAPVVKWISHRPPKPGVEVRFLSGALHKQPRPPA